MLRRERDPALDAFDRVDDRPELATWQAVAVGVLRLGPARAWLLTTVPFAALGAIGARWGCTSPMTTTGTSRVVTRVECRRGEVVRAARRSP